MLKNILLKSASARTASNSTTTTNIINQLQKRNFGFMVGGYQQRKTFEKSHYHAAEFSQYPEMHYDYMSILDEEVDTRAADYQRNYEAMSRLNFELDEIVERNLSISDAQKAKIKKQEKLSPRERINKVLDRGHAFLEIGQLAGYSVDDKENVPSGNIVAGIGMIAGRHCMVVANNYTHKGGAYYPITVKKHLRAQEIAEQNNLPCVYLVDSAGAFLPKQDDVFPDRNHFGRIFFNQARMSAKGIPQVSVVLGSCTAGGAYVPAMSDEVVMVDKNATIFLGGPPLVQAATGEIISAEKLGGATLHSTESGVSDHIAHNEEHGLQLARAIVHNLGTESHFQQNHHNKILPCEPIYDADELNGIISVDHKRQFSMKAVLGRVLDGSRFHEFKANYGSSLVTGFGHLYGHPVGIVANEGVLFSESAQKGAHFVNLCAQRKIPLVFLQNITGFMVGQNAESEGIAKHGAKMVSAVANANVPKLTCIVGASYGAGNYGMCGRAYDPRFLFMLPSAKISVMGGQQASEVLSLVKFKNQGDPKKVAAFKKSIHDDYDSQASAYYSTSRLWDDGIIKAADMRRVIGLGLTTSLNAKIEETKSGVYRM